MRSIMRNIIAGAAVSLALTSAAMAQMTRLGNEGVPPLVVVVSIDQFRGDFVFRFRPFFSEGGFVRLMSPGRFYENAYYAHANTYTGPGHATMMTGTYAHNNGITGNDWYSEAEGKNVYCVRDENAKTVTSLGIVDPSKDLSPLLARTGLSSLEKGSYSPRTLLANTVGDNLEAATRGAAKTYSLATKDRSSILMGGQSCDLAMWWDSAFGEFVTSDYYAQEQPEWLAEFNKTRPADKWFKATWDLSVASQNYVENCTIDDYPAESTGGFTTRTFPHILGEKSETPDRDFYETFRASPYSNDLIVDLSLYIIEKESLGKDAIPDILTISFSANDYIGHAFGPQSWEVMDATIKTDRTIERLLNGLDKAVGVGNWTLFLTADHGVADFPEVLQERRVDAKRVSQREMIASLEGYLRQKLGEAKPERQYVREFNAPWVVFDHDAGQTPLASGLLEETTVAYMMTLPEITFACTTKDLLSSPSDGDPLRAGIRLAYYPGRAGDVAFAMQPNYFFAYGKTGTTHGTPWRYDQFVPIFACGKGITNGRDSAYASPPQIAPTIALLLQIPMPSRCEVPPLRGALLNRF